MPIANTLENATKLEALGAPAPLARGIAEIVEEAIPAGNQDLKAFFREEMERQFAAFRAEMKAEFAAVRGEIVAVRGELKTEIAQTRAEPQREMRQQRLWFFTMAAGIATISVAIIQLFSNAG